MTTKTDIGPFKAGNDFELDFTVEDPDNGSITGATIEFKIFEYKYGDFGEELVSKDDDNNGVTIVNGAARTFNVVLDAVDTAGLDGRYWYAVRITTVEGEVFNTNEGFIDLDPNPFSLSA